MLDVYAGYFRADAVPKEVLYIGVSLRLMYYLMPYCSLIS